MQCPYYRGGWCESTAPETPVDADTENEYCKYRNYRLCPQYSAVFEGDARDRRNREKEESRVDYSFGGGSLGGSTGFGDDSIIGAILSYPILWIGLPVWILWFCFLYKNQWILDWFMENPPLLKHFAAGGELCLTAIPVSLTFVLTIIIMKLLKVLGRITSIELFLDLHDYILMSLITTLKIGLAIVGVSIIPLLYLSYIMSQ